MKFDELKEKGLVIKEYVVNNKVISIVLGVSLFMNVVLWTACSNTTNNLNERNVEIQELTRDFEAKQKKVDSLSLEVSQLRAENRSLEAKVEEASPWFEMKEEERKAEEERLAKEKAEKEEAERKAKEEEERKAKEEAEKKEKQGYNTGITYSQLARTPEDYKEEKVKFSGKVIQVSEGFLSDTIRLAVGGNYDNVLYLTVPIGTTEERILEDDYITIYGVSKGIETYTTIFGASVSIPKVSVDKIDN